MLSPNEEARAGSLREPQLDSSGTPTTRGTPSITHSVVKSRARVVDLEVYRHGRYLQLTSSVSVPCTGTCECWGAPLGGWSA
jgi:hypothetical protein